MRSLAGPAARGITLVEVACVLAIASVTMGLALPSVHQIRDRALVRSAAALVETDLHHARSSAVTMNRVLRMSFGTDGASSCYVLHTGSEADDCRCSADGSAQCSNDAVALRTTRFNPSTDVRLSANVRSMSFEPVRGIVTPAGTISAQSAGGHTIKVVVNVLGRVRTCTPGGTLEGHARC